jgi:hypothetical protein
MKRMGIVIAAVMLFASAEAALAADAYEFVTVKPPTSDTSLGIFRINVATGQVVTAWGNPQNYTVIADTPALPAGQYHLRVPETLDQKGNWYLIRFDSQSGRFWLAVGGGSAPYTWSEITAPSQ